MGTPARGRLPFETSYKSVDNALRRFNEIGTHLALPGRAIIFEQSQCSSQVFVVRLGRAKLFSTSKEGRRMIIRVAGPGDILGLSAALNDLPYEVSAQTLRACAAYGRTTHGLIETYRRKAEKRREYSLNQYRELFLDTRRLALSGSAARPTGAVTAGLGSTR